MRVKIIQKDAGLSEQDNEIINIFLQFLYDKMPLENTKSISFLGNRDNDMTTGVFKLENGNIKVLSKGRMLIDVLRTLAHEWIHGAEHEILGWGKGPNIGGPNENICNIYSGMLMKEFQKEFPKYKEMLYQSCTA